MLLGALLGCAESSDPISPRLEQAVFTALGGLQVGEAITLSGAEAAELSIESANTSREFVFIPFHASNSQNRDLQIEVRGENVGAVSTRSAIGGSAEGDSHISSSAVVGFQLHQDLHGKLHAAARSRLRSVRTPSNFRAALNPRGDLRGRSASVGELVQINTTTFGDLCEMVDNRTGRVEAITERAILVGDVNNPSGGFTATDYQELGREFDSLVHPTVTQFFDTPTDIDENGKVIIFVTRAVNELTLDDEDGFVGGFFYARDLLSREGCNASNEGEIFFVLAPDPQAQASPLVHTRESVLNSALGTIGHEYQHLINAGRRIYVNNARDPEGFILLEESWLDEGLAHVAEEVLFYAAAGLAPRSNIADVGIGTARNAFFRFGYQNPVRYSFYLEDVTRQSPTGLDNLESRGAAWSFLRYVADQTESLDEELFRSLVNSKMSGIENLEEVLQTEDAAEWFQRWGVSVFTDDFVPGAADPLLMQPSWNFRSLLPSLHRRPFPLDVREIRSGETLQLTIKSMSSGYIRFGSASGEVSRLFTTSGGATPPESLRITVVRIE